MISASYKGLTEEDAIGAPEATPGPPAPLPPNMNPAATAAAPAAAADATTIPTTAPALSPELLSSFTFAGTVVIAGVVSPSAVVVVCPGTVVVVAGVVVCPGTVVVVAGVVVGAVVCPGTVVVVTAAHSSSSGVSKSFWSSSAAFLSSLTCSSNSLINLQLSHPFLMHGNLTTIFWGVNLLLSLSCLSRRSRSRRSRRLRSRSLL